VPPSESQTISATQQEDAYVTSGLTTLAAQAGRLEADISAGNLTQARADWLTGHLDFERLGSAYGMFASYDDDLNGTPFGLTGGVSSSNFTGFYRIEYGLWHGQSAAELAGPARDLAASARALRTSWAGMQMQPPFALSDLALRTHEILENAMQFQLSGQDDFGSGTTLATLAAGIQVTQRQLGILHPLLVGRYGSLTALDSSLDHLQALVNAYHRAGHWVSASRLSIPQRELLDAAAGQTVELLSGIPTLFEAKPMP
jgi:iron uptake system EfeUOB component EfeO/EfeM